MNKRVEQIYTWREVDNRWRYQVDYDRGFSDTGVVDTYEEIEEICNRLGYDVNKVNIIEDRRREYE